MCPLPTPDQQLVSARNRFALFFLGLHHKFVREADYLCAMGILGYRHRIRFLLLYSILQALSRRDENWPPDMHARYPEKAKSNLNIYDPNKSSYPFEPTPDLLIRWTLELLPKSLTNWCFVDIGAGNGRVIAYASTLSFQKVIGIEINTDLARIASQRIENSSGRGRIKIENIDATYFYIPNKEPCVFYMFNPFPQPTMEKFIRNAVQSYEAHNRPMIILYLNPTEARIIDAMDAFQIFQQPMSTRIKFNLISPFKLNIYVTPEALPYLT